MEPKQWEVFTVAPVERVGDVEWTPVALDQMLNGGGAVREATSRWYTRSRRWAARPGPRRVSEGEGSKPQNLGEGERHKGEGERDGAVVGGREKTRPSRVVRARRGDGVRLRRARVLLQSRAGRRSRGAARRFEGGRGLSGTGA